MFLYKLIQRLKVKRVKSKKEPDFDELVDPTVARAQQRMSLDIPISRF